MMSWAEKQLKMNDEHHFFSECSQTSQLTKIQRMQLNVLLNDIATGYFFSKRLTTCPLFQKRFSEINFTFQII